MSAVDEHDGEAFKVAYTFIMSDGREEQFDLTISLPDVIVAHDATKSPASWTALDHCKCRHCPLSSDAVPVCPVAVRLEDVGERLGKVVSYEKIELRVEAEERTTIATTPSSNAIRSLLGLIMAASGCPKMAFFRPLARHHLPLAKMEETFVRSMGFYLLSQYFQGRAQEEWDTSFQGLIEIYEDASIVNEAMSRRLKTAQVFDELNWLAELDAVSGLFPLKLEMSLMEAKRLFDAVNRPQGNG